MTRQDGSAAVLAAMSAAAEDFLQESGTRLLEQTRQNSRVCSGQTAEGYALQQSATAQAHTLCIGSALENAVYEELGTGEYALRGDGRRGGWVYRNAAGEFYFTRGKTPNRPLERAWEAERETLAGRLSAALGAMEV